MKKDLQLANLFFFTFGYFLLFLIEIFNISQLLLLSINLKIRKYNVVE